MRDPPLEVGIFRHWRKTPAILSQAKTPRLRIDGSSYSTITFSEKTLVLFIPQTVCAMTGCEHHLLQGYSCRGGPKVQGAPGNCPSGPLLTQKSPWRTEHKRDLFSMGVPWRGRLSMGI